MVAGSGGAAGEPGSELLGQLGLSALGGVTFGAIRIGGLLNGRAGPHVSHAQAQPSPWSPWLELCDFGSASFGLALQQRPFGLAPPRRMSAFRLRHRGRADRFK